MAALLTTAVNATPAAALDDNQAVTEPLEVSAPPAFPEPLSTTPLRFWVGSFAAPSADFGGSDITLARPELRMRVRLPINRLFRLELEGEFSSNLYDTDDGDGPVFAKCPQCTIPHEAYSASLDTQAGYVFNRARHLFRADERWAVLAGLGVSASWEPGAFEESVSPGGSLSLGYELPSMLRIALGVSLQRALDGDGVDVGPSVYVRWDISPEVRLRNRGLGLRIEYRRSDRFEVFATGYQSSDRFRLDDRAGLSGGATFGDRQVLVGGGFVLDLSRAFRVTLETGAIVDRNLSVETRKDGQLEGVDGDVSPYLTFRLEIRV